MKDSTITLITNTKKIVYKEGGLGYAGIVNLRF